LTFLLPNVILELKTNTFLLYASEELMKVLAKNTNVKGGIVAAAVIH